MEERERSPAAERYICVHCHFYQPPRENPWLESVEVQDSAYPFHDWNERITSECYAPNLASRIVNGYGRITDIVSNYSRISFNFGPTLLAWMRTFAPAVYEGILQADRLSVSLRSGHGNALAQVYNHIIMPLANSRDRRTRVIWGIRDFRKIRTRTGRDVARRNGCGRGDSRAPGGLRYPFHHSCSSPGQKGQEDRFRQMEGRNGGPLILPVLCPCGFLPATG